MLGHLYWERSLLRACLGQEASEPEGSTRSASDCPCWACTCAMEGRLGNYTRTCTHYAQTVPLPLPEPGDALATYSNSPPRATCCCLQSHFQSPQMPAGWEGNEEVRTRDTMTGYQLDIQRDPCWIKTSQIHCSGQPEGCRSGLCMPAM